MKAIVGWLIFRNGKPLPKLYTDYAAAQSNRRLLDTVAPQTAESMRRLSERYPQ